MNKTNLFITCLFSFFTGIVGLRAQPATDAEVNAALLKLFGNKAFYSSALCHKDTKNHFMEKYYPESSRFTKVVYLDWGPDITLYYPRIGKKATNADLAELKVPKDISNDAWPEWHIHPDPKNKENFRYRLLPNMVGIIKVSDKEFVLFFAPAIPGKTDAVDFDLFDCDIICTDEAAAMAANTNARKKEVLEMVRKNIDPEDLRRADDARKNSQDVKPAPVGMKNPELEKKMFAMCQGLWDEHVVATNEQKLDLAEGKIAKVWISSTAWVINRDELNQIINRSIFAQAMYRTTHNCYLYDIRFIQAYNGSGYDNGVSVDFPEASTLGQQIRRIPCENVK